MLISLKGGIRVAKERKPKLLFFNKLIYLKLSNQTGDETAKWPEKALNENILVE